MCPTVARNWLSWLVDKRKVSYSTQKVALNSLAFLYRDVCGHDKVNLQVKLRKTGRRIPAVLDQEELLRLFGALDQQYTLLAELQYGAGLRLRELMSLRIKDIDLKSSSLTIRCGKGDKDRVTILPHMLKEKLATLINANRKIYLQDRLENQPGVALSPSLSRKMPRAGERWEWFWLFLKTISLETPKAE